MNTKAVGAGTRQGRNFHSLVKAGAVLYIAECHELDALKVGVTSRASRTSRVRQHARHGWRTTAEIPFDSGRQAFVAEQAILAFLRACGARETLRQDQLPQGGYTETIAFARQAHLSADQLIAVAQIAAGIVEATEGPLYTIEVMIKEVVAAVNRMVEHIQTLRRTGRRQEADKLAVEARLAIDEITKALRTWRHALAS
ncbi:hypothetical protein [Streptomyces antarcticus]|uniref:hypothetical protein n=1 Tax=Streptomyces antarcticus TaxID=2996458 RepID=UPI002271D15B|nr:MULTISPECIES: hypothetical protein [unclassified Streptomyces]MCY0942385.1 hypothetical protein [Streptomyces sp. H34-AA3]MCZ4080618.1 hypothetical protein [Streptomyces sp. H34-S5]